MIDKLSFHALDNYLFFVAIVEAGSFTGAAKALSMPKSKVSRRLIQLEQQLGSELIIRSTRRLQLTESGRLLYQQCQPHVAALSEMEQLVHESQYQIKGKLSLLLPLEFFNQVIGQLITTFAVSYPDIEINCQHYTGNTPSYDLQYDLVFVLHENPLPDSHWVAKNLLSFPQSIYASQRFEQTENFDALSLVKIKAVVSDENEEWTFRDKHQTKVSPNYSMILASPEMRVQACQQNIGIVKLPDYVAKEASDIKPLALKFPVVAQQLSLLYHSRNIPMKTRVFLDYFQNKIGCLS